MKQQAKWRWIALVAGAVAWGAGYWLYSQPRDRAPVAANGSIQQDDGGRRVLYWYDPMQPAQHFDQPGKSPFMDMMLVPKYADETDATDVRLSAHTVRNLGVRLGKAEMTPVGGTLAAVGRVEADERRIYAVQTRAAGYVERLHVRALGDRVHAGQRIAAVYAPEFVAAQSELLALRKLKDVAGLDALIGGARERLRLLGMAEAEIEAVEAAGSASRTVGVYAPAGGIVQTLGVREGAQVAPGQTWMQIADLAEVWLIAEVPERDIGRLAAGRSATARFEAYPGMDFAGRVDYLYPDLDTQTRTGRVRIALANPRGRLQPGMYAQVNIDGGRRDALTVPSEAVIATGTRQTVILSRGGGFVPAAVETGMEEDGRTEILAGIGAGDDVVLSGQFLIDSEASLSGVLARLAPRETTAGVHGTLTAVDDRHVTLRHGPIPALQWPAMTMRFRLRDPAAARGLARGARVAFEVKLVPEDGEYVIERIEAEGAP